MNFDLRVDRQSATPVGAQLAALLRGMIERGDMPPGERLPSLRDAAAAAGVNVNTVRAVYAKLEAAGVVTTEQGRGTYVTAPATNDGPVSRRAVLDDIARLEAELVSLPLLPRSVVSEAKSSPSTARLLSLEELAAVRDLLAERVHELRIARSQIVGDIERGLDQPQPVRAPSRRSSSSLAGARVRWTGA